MPFLNRDILAQLYEVPMTPQLIAVPCPEWGSDLSVYVRALSVPALEIYERRAAAISARISEALGLNTAETPLLFATADQSAAYLENAPSVRLELVMDSACDEHGALLFTQADAQWLSQQAPGLIKRLFTAAWELNGFGDIDARMDAARKNSASSQSNDSGTSSLINGVSPSALPSSS